MSLLPDWRSSVVKYQPETSPREFYGSRDHTQSMRVIRSTQDDTFTTTDVD